ncbi:MAG: phosphoenolpyruvate carboxykinase (ATP) [Planctomycetia bacterium]|jgi:phosphoenolpyruvate carboxykinase (ATP)
MSLDFDLSQYGITVSRVFRNPTVAKLYEDAVIYDRCKITSAGALLTDSGEKRGRSPKDKRIVDHPDCSDDIWWGDINIKINETSFFINRQRSIDYLNMRERLYVIDGFAGWEEGRRRKFRVICARPYHALFMRNMLVRPTPDELAAFGTPDYVVFEAGPFPADPATPDLTNNVSVNIHFPRGEFVILGSQYAGEIKKGVFTIMNYLMPKEGVLSMHCSCNEGADGDVSLFFGLSGTGKTTLSADPARLLIGDDEHCWTDQGIFNIEGGCYAKIINLSAENEPDIYRAIRYGTVLENAILDEDTREVDYEDGSLTENTRASYPVEFIDNAKIPCVCGHPSNVIFLTCDAFGVLPPVSCLTPEQAMYHFISGYTAKVAGTEVGIVDPEATFSACFGAAFLVWHPAKYAEMLAEQMKQHGAKAWLVNTGWTGGPFGVGHRLSIKHTRAIIDAIHSGELANAPTVDDPRFGLAVPTECSGVPSDVLDPRTTWSDQTAYDAQADKLANLFRENFKQYESGASAAIKNAGPK